MQINKVKCVKCQSDRKNGILLYKYDTKQNKITNKKKKKTLQKYNHYLDLERDLE